MKTVPSLWPVLAPIVAAMFCTQFGLAQQQVDTSARPDFQALKKEVETLKQSQLAMQQELREIKDLLRGRALAASSQQNNLLFHIDDVTPVEGDQNAKLVLIEFSDYECPFCASFFCETYPKIKRDYVDTGKLRYVLCDFPLSTIHKDALKAAEAAHCAGEHGKLEEMRALLFKNQSRLTSDDLSTYANVLGLDLPKFHECLGSERYTSWLNERIAEAGKSGVRSTPSLAFGFAERDGRTFKLDKIIRGDPPYAFLEQIITNLLTRQQVELGPIRKDPTVVGKVGTNHEQ